MNIKFSLKAKKTCHCITMRVYYSKIDLSVNLDLFVSSDDWDFEEGQTKNNLEINKKLQSLKLAVLNDYNLSLVNGIAIDKNWLKNVVYDVFNTQNKVASIVCKDANVYLCDFGSFWLETFADKWKVNHKDFMNDKIKSQYKKTIELLADFEKQSKQKIVLKDFSKDLIYDFINYLLELYYNRETVKRQINRFKFFCNRAAECNLKVSTASKQRYYIEKEEELDKVYLNNKEIKLILKYDFSFDRELETTKDNFILGLFTGLRVSDFIENLNISNFKDGFLKVKTQKTKSNVIIPIHKEVEFVLKKYGYNLPPKQSLKEFNEKIKLVCQVVEIDEIIEGKLFGKEKNRKVRGFYKKFQLISSHCIRRSFVTNLRGKISDESLCKLLGWSTKKMLEIYDQNSKYEPAKDLQEFWNNDY